MSALPEYVVDASVAAKWILTDEDDIDHALRILSDFVGGRSRLLAPDHIIAEIASTLSVASSPSRGRLSRVSGRQGLAMFLAFEMETTPSRDLVSEAFDFADQFVCSVYDALYVVLARRRAVPFVNADRILHDRIGHLAGVLWIAAYVSPADQDEN
jgi:predicted nucleic acid-binding protein